MSSLVYLQPLARKLLVFHDTVLFATKDETIMGRDGRPVQVRLLCCVVAASAVLLPFVRGVCCVLRAAVALWLALHVCFKAVRSTPTLSRA